MEEYEEFKEYKENCLFDRSPPGSWFLSLNSLKIGPGKNPSSPAPLRSIATRIEQATIFCQKAFSPAPKTRATGMFCIFGWFTEIVTA
jgi:hypothetical protein